MRPPFRFLPLLAATLLLAAGCGPSASKEGAAPATGAAAAAPEMEADLKRTLAAEPEFYVFKPLAELPADLAWQDGAALPEFADPNARKGGTFNYYIPDFPRTLRTIGPDATGGIRPYLLDYVEPPFIAPHPNVAGGAYAGLVASWAVGPDGKTVYYRIDPEGALVRRAPAHHRRRRLHALLHA